MLATEQGVCTKREISRPAFHRSRHCWLALIAAAVIVCGSSELAQAGNQEKTMPEFSAVKKTVVQHFKKLPGHESEDIISRGQVRPIFDQLKRLGWVVADRNKILDSVPNDNDFIVQQLRKPGEEKFMRKISRNPESYDRLEKISRLDNGKQAVRDIMRGSGGDEIIEYLTTAAGSKRMRRSLTKEPHGAKFFEPTSRIYTVAMLLNRLQASYKAAKKQEAAHESGPVDQTLSVTP
jgi:hypothetical protein